MKKFRNSHDDGRFALTTLQNPTLEVRGLRQLIATSQEIVAQDAAAPDALPSGDALPPKEEQLDPEETAEEAAADDPLPQAWSTVAELLAAEAALPQNAAPEPETSLDPAEPPDPQPRRIRKTLVRRAPRSSRNKTAQNPPRSLAPRPTARTH
jgi:hypothetical protein